MWSDAQRRAIIACDGHCTHPGCTRGPEWCDIHHVQGWDDGGPTDVANGTLRCRWHHTWHHLRHRDHRRRRTWS
ncbi:MAG: HNH endonuclease signature motif containing protein [Acidimicrobiales bacterium]